VSRIFFIAANTSEEPYAVYPLGMSVVTYALRDAGHEVFQYDFLHRGKSLTDLTTRLHAFKPDFICVSVRNVDGCDSTAPEGSWYLGATKDIIDEVKKVSNVPIICGGPGFSVMPERILLFLQADYGISGEGETALCDLIARLESGERPEKITQGGAFPLAGDGQLPAAYDADLVEFYQQRSGVMGVQSKRGCPFKCSYCTYPLIEGRHFRQRNPVAVVDDIERLQRRHGCNQFFFTDAVFNDASRQYLGVVEELIKRDLGIRWSSYFSPRAADLDKLALMKESGLSHVELGTDAASDVTLKGMQKGFTFEDVFRFNAACVELRIPIAHFIIFGGPDETMETVLEGIDNIARLKSSVVFPFLGARILPDTPLYHRAIEDKIIEPQDDLLRPVYYFSPGVDRAAMEQALSEAFKRDSTRLFPHYKVAKLSQMAWQLGLNGELWDRLISYE
jgi:lipid biosynthesis B12-binding/radical SAM protein